MSIEGEIELLQSALQALEGGDIASGISLLKEYADVLPAGSI